MPFHGDHLNLAKPNLKVVRTYRTEDVRNGNSIVGTTALLVCRIEDEPKKRSIAIYGNGKELEDQLQVEDIQKIYRIVDAVKGQGVLLQILYIENEVL